MPSHAQGCLLWGMALLLPPGIPKHPGGLLPPPLSLFLRHPSAHLWKLTSVGLLFYTSSELPPSFQRSPPPCFWAAQLHQGPIQLIPIPVLLFIHSSHHRDGNSISPVFIGPGPERQEPKGLSPTPSLPTPPPLAVLWLHPTTSSFANGRLCVTRPLHELLFLPGAHLPWLHCLKTSSDITSFEKPL